MQSYLILLRGVNVAGKNILSMKELKSELEKCGFENAKTYIQSGNILLQSYLEKPEIHKSIEDLMLSNWGYTVSTFILEKEELTSIITTNPFQNETLKSPDKVLITFFKQSSELNLNGSIFHPDQFVISSNFVYLFCPNGYGNTKLNGAFFERKTKTMTTTRNYKTLKIIHELLCDYPI